MLDVLWMFRSPYDPLPQVKGKILVVGAAAALFAVGLAIALTFSAPSFLLRIGNLMVLAAAAFAFFGSRKISDVDLWLRDSITMAELEASLIPGHRGEYEATLRNLMPPCEVARGLAEAAALSGVTLSDEPTYAEVYEVLREIRQSASHKELITTAINRQLYRTEFAVAAVGICLAAFGDYLVQVIAAAAIWLAD